MIEAASLRSRCGIAARTKRALRLLSLTGVHATQLLAQFWQSFDRRAADLQDALLNEPWFLVEGIALVALGLACTESPRRGAWLVTALGACLLLTVVGVLSGLDVIGSFSIG